MVKKPAKTKKGRQASQPVAPLPAAAAAAAAASEGSGEGSGDAGVAAAADAAAAVHAAIRAAAPAREIELEGALRGHESAVEALAHSARRAGRSVQDWAAESRARRWWEPRRGVRLDALSDGGARQRTAVNVRRVLTLASEAAGAEVEAEAAGGAEAADDADAAERLRAASFEEAMEAALRFWRPGGGSRAPAVRWSLGGAEVATEAATGVATDAGEALDAEAEAATDAREATAAEAADERLGAMRAAAGTFKLEAPYAAAGDQPGAIASLVADVQGGAPRSALRGATGTGKTFVMASVIAQTNRPALLVAPNKVLIHRAVLSRWCDPLLTVVCPSPCRCSLRSCTPS